MNAQRNRPHFPIVKGTDLSLSRRTLVEIVKAVLDKGAAFRFQAKGFSMSPFIKNKDVVTISPLHARRPKVGDIIAFVYKETNGLCIHRIVLEKGGLYVTKGDNRSEMAEYVSRQSMLGFVTRVERDGKEVFLGLGPERFLIAFLGRRGLLFPLLFPVVKFARLFLKRSSN